MPRRTAISFIHKPAILTAALVAACGAGPPPAPPVPSPPLLIGPVPVPPEVQAEYMRLERIAGDWALGLSERHGLLHAQCLIALDRGERSSCVVQLDGITLHIMKTDRAPSAAVEALLLFSNLVDDDGHRITVIGGKWIRVGDVFELEAGRAVYAHYCEAAGEADYVFAQCRWARDHKEIAARATRPLSRYDFKADRAQRDVGTALLNGKLRVFHNGSRVDVAPLIAATRDFARMDFARLARR
jgi:hypothetical protein